MERAYIYDYKFCENKRCKKRFDCKYRNARFCCSSCRVDHHREKKAAEKLVNSVLMDMDRLMRMNIRSESVSAGLKRIAKMAESLADEWEYVRPL